MSELSENKIFTKLAADAAAWRKSGYPSAYPLIKEILNYQYTNEENREPRFLRTAQLTALEIYWYLRLCKNTPHIMDMYKEYYPKKRDFVEALGITLSEDEKYDIENIDEVIAKLKTTEWAKEKKIDSIHEAAILEYPGYIFALAMGAGKTILIGAIIATEFAMALRYTANANENPQQFTFMQNALVFAPGLTIIQSLREIDDMDMEQILPPAIYKKYAANVKINYARGNKKETLALHGSVYNIIVSNSEKINLRAVPQKDKLNALEFQQKNEQAELIANARLQTIVSLPALGVFSDEAHHTYGNKIDDSLKRVRETVNYIHSKTPLVAVINTTGTPYSKKRILSEVVCWYGLGDGIKDNVLKNLDKGIHTFGKDTADDDMVGRIIKMFFDKYENTKLPNGAPAKIAFYFKFQEHLDELRPHIEKAMLQIKQSPTQILVNTQKSSSQEVDDFNRLNDPSNQKRVILLVQKGGEGWNCPSLFACALVKDAASNIHVLQAATRCLRQTPGNTQGASVFLSADNERILQTALQQNFGIGISDLNNEKSRHEILVKIQKTNLPKLEITHHEKYIVRCETKTDIVLRKPKTSGNDKETLTISTPNYDDGVNIMQPANTKVAQFLRQQKSTDCFSATVRIVANYHLHPQMMFILKQLQTLFPTNEISAADFADLLQQIEKQTLDYETKTRKIKEVLALIKTIDKNGAPVFETENGCLVHRLRFSDSEFKKMVKHKRIVAAYSDSDSSTDTTKGETKVNDNHDLSFHYIPYCLDSAPESDFFHKIFAILEPDEKDIEAFLFTGYANDRISDFYFSYQGEDGGYHNYFPDFILLKKNGSFLVVEIKAKNEENHPTTKAKAKAMKSITDLRENRFRYKVIYVADTQISADNAEMGEVRDWIQES